VTLIERGIVTTPFFDEPPVGMLDPDDSRAVMYAVSQPPHVEVNQLLIRLDGAGGLSREHAATLWAVLRRSILLTLCAGLLVSAAQASHPAQRFQGATLTHPASPPDFALRDQHGHLFRLSQQKGRAVLVTFLYTHCPDVCPLTAANLNTALGLLGPSRNRVSVVAVRVDPRGDTRQAVAAFIRSHHLRPQFHYVTGNAPALERVWHAYQVKAVRSGKDAGVDHTLYTLLVDPHGTARVLFDVQARPAAIAHDVRLVLR